MEQPKIQMKDFYGIASILMIIVVAANIWNLTSNWGLMNLPSKISFIAGSIIFQLLLFGLFFGLWKSTPRIGNIVEDKVLDDVLKNIENIQSIQKEVDENVRKQKKEKNNRRRI